jgi:hypothetical protein
MSDARLDDGDNWHNNIGYTPAAWIALHRSANATVSAISSAIYYDPSHCDPDRAGHALGLSVPQTSGYGS